MGSSWGYRTWLPEAPDVNDLKLRSEKGRNETLATNRVLISHQVYSKDVEKSGKPTRCETLRKKDPGKVPDLDQKGLEVRFEAAARKTCGRED